MALIPPHFMKAVVAIGNKLPDGQVAWIGSGFFYGRSMDATRNGLPLYRIYLVTNRHVLGALTTPVLRANPVGHAPARLVDLDLVDTSGAPLWSAHPDPEVDVAVTGIAWDALRSAGLDIEFIPEPHAQSVAEMAVTGVSEGDSLFLLGFPMGLVGEERSAVVVRGGTLARFSDLRDGYEKRMLADAYIYPGNSGGPVFTKPEGIAIQGTTAVSSAYLVGIVAAYITYRDAAVSQQTGNVRVIFEENSGLAQVYPVDAIRLAADFYALSHPAAAPDQNTEAVPDETVPEVVQQAPQAEGTRSAPNEGAEGAP